MKSGRACSPRGLRDGRRRAHLHRCRRRHGHSAAAAEPPDQESGASVGHAGLRQILPRGRADPVRRAPAPVCAGPRGTGPASGTCRRFRRLVTRLRHRGAAGVPAAGARAHHPRRRGPEPAGHHAGGSGTGASRRFRGRGPRRRVAEGPGRDRAADHPHGPRRTQWAAGGPAARSPRHPAPETHLTRRWQATLLLLPEDDIEAFTDSLHRATARAGLPAERTRLASSATAAAAEVLAGQSLLLCDEPLARRHRLPWSPLADRSLDRGYEIRLSATGALGHDAAGWLAPLLGAAIGASAARAGDEPDHRTQPRRHG